MYKPKILQWKIIILQGKLFNISAFSIEHLKKNVTNRQSHGIQFPGTVITCCTCLVTCFHVFFSCFHVFVTCLVTCFQRWGGRLVVVGFASGSTTPKDGIAKIPLNLALLNERKILGCGTGTWEGQPMA